MSLNFLHLWLVVMILVLTAAPIIRKVRGEKPPNERDFVISAFALGSAISLLKVSIKIITNNDLQTALEFDGAIATLIGCGFGLYLSFREIWKLLVGN